MRIRMTPVTVTACLLGAIAGASLRSIAGPALPARADVPAAAFVNFEALEQRRSVPLPKNGGLQLLVRASRFGTSDLRLDIDLWNVSSHTLRVAPIYFDYCLLDLKDADGKSLSPYRIAPGYPAPVGKSEIIPLPPRNRLGATYLLPHFYSRVNWKQGMRIAAELFDGRPNGGRNSVRSGWIEIPPP
jgi:hypothetical protein